MGLINTHFVLPLLLFPYPVGRVWSYISRTLPVVFCNKNIKGISGLSSISSSIIKFISSWASGSTYKSFIPMLLARPSPYRIPHSSTTSLFVIPSLLWNPFNNPPKWFLRTYAQPVGLEFPIAEPSIFNFAHPLSYGTHPSSMAF